MARPRGDCYASPMRPRGFPPSLRVLRGAEFDALLREGGSAADGLLVVHVLHRGSGPPRLGLAVGRDIGDAVRRNRVRRLLREAFRLRREDLPAGHDILARARAGDGATRSLEEFQRSLVALAERAVRRGRNRGPGRAGDGDRAPR